MDLIRLKLLEVEGESQLPELEKYTEEQHAYHMALCIEAGLVDGIIVKDHKGFPSRTAAIRLTWDGHDFLDSARSDTLWNKAKEHLLKPGMSWSFQVLSEYLKHEIKTKVLGMPDP